MFTMATKDTVHRLKEARAIDRARKQAELDKEAAADEHCWPEMVAYTKAIFAAPGWSDKVSEAERPAAGRQVERERKRLEAAIRERCPEAAEVLTRAHIRSDAAGKEIYFRVAEGWTNISEDYPHGV